MKNILSILLSLLLTAELPAHGFLRTDGKNIVNEKGENVLLRGMGLGGWMLQEGYMLRAPIAIGVGQQQYVIRGKIIELIGTDKTKEFYDAWLDNHTRKIDIDSMASWGFNSVRLAMHYDLYLLPAEEENVPGKETWIEKGFAMTDSLLSWCKANKIYLILDLHAAPGGQGNDLNISDRDPSKASLWQSEENQKRTVALWKKLASRYANEPWIGAYDIINEPNWGFDKFEDKSGCSEQSNAPLKKLMMDITRAIREVDQKHIIIIEGNCWGNNYNGVLPPWDKNMVVSFHKYWSYNNEAAIKGSLEIRDKYNVPLWLGESGENSNAWFRDAIHLVESRNIGWAWWPLKKIGFNNPLEVKMPSRYGKVLDYWAGTGPKPVADEAYLGLMELANNLKLENCIYHKDVIDAMFRQTQTDETKPFKPHQVTDVIQAVDYELGSNRFAYLDKDTGNYWVSTGKEATPGNRGTTYRNDGVDIAGDAQTGYYVDHFEPGEWLQYTVVVPRDGKYSAAVVVSTKKANSSIVFNAFGLSDAVIPVSNSGHWQTVFIENIHLLKGANKIKISCSSGDVRFKSLQLRE